MGLDTRLSRKQFLVAALGAAGVAALPIEARAALVQEATKAVEMTEADLAAMERVIGFTLTPEQRKAVMNTAKELKKGYETVQAKKIPNAIAPPMPFVPEVKQSKEGKKIDVRTSRVNPTLPARVEEIPFLSAMEQSSLIRRGLLKPSQLTDIYIARIEKYSPTLLNVITLLKDRARAQAKILDAEAARGKWRGLLHGLPYGLKDLFAAVGGPTTWGAEPYMDQVFTEDSEVVKRLDKAGAILLAKTSVGALAMDDHWFKGKTKNPWNTAQGSSGSSAGSSSGMAAGLFSFSIGTETLGSIMSPAHRCRVTGLRPTFGRVSRHGAMALSWTMDKAGPICRTAEDCAVVLGAICGADPNDLATVDRPFTFRPDIDLKKLKIGYLSDDKGLDEDDSGNGPDDAIKLLRKLGADPKPIKFTPVGDGIDMVLSVEAAAAFDEITRDGRVNTIKNSFWPDIFRQNQFATGVGYVQAQRARVLTMRKFEEELGDFDVIIASDRGSYLLFTTNLTGHPQLYIPFGVDGKGVNRGVSLIGRLYDEGTILGVGARIQQATDFWKKSPDLSKI